jgi:hypothetical protein
MAAAEKTPTQAIRYSQTVVMFQTLNSSVVW